MGFEIEASHHENAVGQHEIDFKYTDALTAADNIMTFKLAVKLLAQKNGLHATPGPPATAPPWSAFIGTSGPGDGAPDPACNPPIWPWPSATAALPPGTGRVDRAADDVPRPPHRQRLYEVGDASGIQRLPGSLEEAVRALEADSVITDALGAHVTEQYLAGKRRECRSYAAQVSQWELEQYLVAY